MWKSNLQHARTYEEKSSDLFGQKCTGYIWNKTTHASATAVLTSFFLFLYNNKYACKKCICSP
jgi:hypothetical protein